MGKPLDAMTFFVGRRWGAWTDGPWVTEAATLAAPVDGDPTPVNVATLVDVSRFVAGEYAGFFDANGAPIGDYQIVTIDPVAKTLTFAAGALAFDAPAGVPVIPEFTIEASRPQPVAAELLEFLDEGARSTARFVIYADDDQPALKLTEDGESSADLVVYDGKYYIATSIDSWAGMPLGYRAYVLLRYALDEAPS